MRLAVLFAFGCFTLSGQQVKSMPVGDPPRHGPTLTEITPGNSKALDFTQTVLGIDGKPLNGDTKPALTLGDIAVTALHSTIEDDKTLSGLDKFKMDELARKIYKSKAAMLSVEDVALIKTRIGKVYGPLVIGATWRLLDPSLIEKQPAAEESKKTK